MKSICKDMAEIISRDIFLFFFFVFSIFPSRKSN
jgi:hypothetical protein